MSPPSVEGPTRPYLACWILLYFTTNSHFLFLLLVSNVLASFSLFFLSSLCPSIPASVSKYYFNSAVLIHDCSLTVLSIPTPQVHKIILDWNLELGYRPYKLVAIRHHFWKCFYIFSAKRAFRNLTLSISSFFFLPTESVLRRCLRLTILEMFKRIFKKKKINNWYQGQYMQI